MHPSDVADTPCLSSLLESWFPISLCSHGFLLVGSWSILLVRVPFGLPSDCVLCFV